MVVQDQTQVPVHFQWYPPTPRPQPHSILELRRLGNWASEQAEVSDIGLRLREPSVTEWSGPCGQSPMLDSVEGGLFPPGLLVSHTDMTGGLGRNWTSNTAGC